MAYWKSSSGTVHRERENPKNSNFKITSASFLYSSGKKCSVSVESTLDLDCNDVNTNSFCDPKTCGLLWEDVLVLQGPSSVSKRFGYVAIVCGSHSITLLVGSQDWLTWMHLWMTRGEQTLPREHTQEIAVLVSHFSPVDLN